MNGDLDEPVDPGMHFQVGEAAGAGSTCDGPRPPLAPVRCCRWLRFGVTVAPAPDLGKERRLDFLRSRLCDSRFYRRLERRGSSGCGLLDGCVSHQRGLDLLRSYFCLGRDRSGSGLSFPGAHDLFGDRLRLQPPLVLRPLRPPLSLRPRRQRAPASRPPRGFPLGRLLPVRPCASPGSGDSGRLPRRQGSLRSKPRYVDHNPRSY